MKGLRSLLALAVLLIAPLAIKAQAPEVPLDKKVMAATVAIYEGHQVCKYEEVDLGIFGVGTDWACSFKSSFTCSGILVKTDGEGGYIGVTAGHCFNWDKENDYYVADGISDQPVLRRIVLQKFENDDRYDYAVFTFRSRVTQYPVIPLDTTSPTEIGTPVLNVNFALGLGKQVVEGKIVSDILAPVERRADAKGRYLVSIGIGPGASGSAVVNAKTGMVVGLVEAIYPGTQMPTVVMPIGKTFVNFYEDDSAGLKPQKPGPPPATAATPPSPSATDHFKQGLSGLWDSIVEWFWAN